MAGGVTSVAWARRAAWGVAAAEVAASSSSSVRAEDALLSLDEDALSPSLNCEGFYTPWGGMVCDDVSYLKQRLIQHRVRFGTQELQEGQVLHVLGRGGLGHQIKF